MAREHPRYATMEWPDYEFQEYPMMYYPGAPNQKKPYIDAPGTADHGRPLKGVVVNNEEELRSLVEGDKRAAAGDDSGSPDLIPTSAKGVSRVRTEADDKADLIAEAEALGMQFDKRWGVTRLEDEIAAFRQAQAEPVV